MKLCSTTNSLKNSIDLSVLNSKKGTSSSELARKHAENKSLKRQFFEFSKHTIFKDLSKFDLIDNETFVEKWVEWRNTIKDQFEIEIEIETKPFLCQLRD